MVTLIVISKKDGGDWLPEITKADRNRQPVVHGIQGTQSKHRHTHIK